MKTLFGLYKKLIFTLGRINTLVILTIVYFAFIPVFYMIFLRKKSRSNNISAWLKKESDHPKSYEHQF